MSTATLNWKANKLNDMVSTTHHRLFPSTRGTRSAGETVSFTLPSNSIIDLKSLRTVLKVNNGHSASITTGSSAHAFIQRLQVSVAGTVVTSINNYSEFAAKLDVLTTPADKASAEPFSRNVSIAAGASADVVVKGFLAGLLCGSHMRYLDTGLLRDVKIDITLSPIKAACSTNAGVETDMAYEDQYLTYDCVSFAEDTYREMLRDTLRNGDLEVNFRNAFTVTSPAYSDATQYQFRLTTGALNRIFAMPKASGYLSAVNGMSTTAANANTKYSIQVNGHRLHSYDLDLVDAWGQTEHALEPWGGVQNNVGSAWVSAHVVLPATLSLAGKGAPVSGLDTFKVAGDITVNVSGDDSSKVLLIACETTSKVTVKADGSVEYTH